MQRRRDSKPRVGKVGRRVRKGENSGAPSRKISRGFWLRFTYRPVEGSGRTRLGGNGLVSAGDKAGKARLARGRRSEGALCGQRQIRDWIFGAAKDFELAFLLKGSKKRKELQRIRRFFYGWIFPSPLRLALEPLAARCVLTVLRRRFEKACEAGGLKTHRCRMFCRLGILIRAEIVPPSGYLGGKLLVAVEE